MTIEERVAELERRYELLESLVAGLSQLVVPSVPSLEEQHRLKLAARARGKER